MRGSVWVGLLPARFPAGWLALWEEPLLRKRLLMGHYRLGPLSGRRDHVIWREISRKNSCTLRIPLCKVGLSGCLRWQEQTCPFPRGRPGKPFDPSPCISSSWSVTRQVMPDVTLPALGSQPCAGPGRHAVQELSKLLGAVATVCHACSLGPGCRPEKTGSPAP